MLNQSREYGVLLCVFRRVGLLREGAEKRRIEIFRTEASVPRIPATRFISPILASCIALALPLPVMKA